MVIFYYSRVVCKGFFRLGGELSTGCLGVVSVCWCEAGENKIIAFFVVLWLNNYTPE